MSEAIKHMRGSTYFLSTSLQLVIVMDGAAMNFHLIAIVLLLTLYQHNAQAQTGAEAFGLGCGGGCHSTDRKVIKAIPKGHEKMRQQWLINFMSQHPCNRDDLKPLILNYLLERTRR